jgi:hypothetical protein
MPDRITDPPPPDVAAKLVNLAAAQFGFGTLDGYLADRVVQRGWPLQQIADQLGIDVRTLRDRLQRLALDRRRATTREATEPTATPAQRR